MQFIFGDNTSKYTMLFFDDKPDNAAKVKDMVRLPYSPNPDFDAFGFIPFGINNNRALFFKFQKDTKMVRNVYLLHGVYNDPDPEYFFGEEYINGIFTGFVDQNGFDTLRDAQLAGAKDLSVPYFCQTELATTPYDQIPLDPIILHEIVSKLYQRTRVVLVMDDEKFTKDSTRLLIKKIFSFLTPSLRKVCSYITAVDSTGDMEFLVRIIPRSMMQKDEVVIDLDAPARPYTDKTGFSDIGKLLLEMTDEQRKALFDTFELLHYGKASIYKKQNFQIFFESYTAPEYTEEVIGAYDKILGEYLSDGKCPDEPVIPDYLQKALYPIYSSERLLDGLINWETESLDNACGFYDENIDAIKKVFYLCNKELSYFESKLKERYESPCLAKDIVAIKALCEKINEEDLQPKEDAQPSEVRFLAIASERYQYLIALCNEYDDAVTTTMSLINSFIEKRFADTRIEDLSDATQFVLTEYLGAKSISEKITDIYEHLAYRIKTECVDTHNAEYDRKVKQALEAQEKSYREQTLADFIALLQREEILKKEEIEKALAEKLAAEQAKKQKKKPVKDEASESVQEFDVFSGTPDEDPSGTSQEESKQIEDAAEVPSFSDKEEIASQQSEMSEKADLREPTYEELQDVANDPLLCPELAKAMASYLINICLMTKEPSFPSHDRFLSMIEGDETLALTARQLCEKGHPEFAVLYLAAYAATPETAIDAILKMEEADGITGKQMATVNKFLAVILEEKSLDFALDNETAATLAAFAEQLGANKEVSKSRKSICKILLSSPFFCQIKGPKKKPKLRLDNANKRAIIIIAIVDVVVLAIIATVVAIIIGTSGNDDVTTNPSPTPNSSPAATETVTAQQDIETVLGDITNTL